MEETVNTLMNGLKALIMESITNVHFGWFYVSL